jgi:hypothetical protein
MTTKDTPNGRIISHSPISTEMEAAADECFVAYKTLDEKVKKFHETIPEGFGVKNFYGNNGSVVIIDSVKDLDAEAKYWEENS